MDEWPGNARELRNALENAVAACSGEVIQPHHLPKAVSPSAGLPATIDLDGVLRLWVAANQERRHHGFWPM